MAAAWISCPQCRLFFQREATQAACPGCGAALPPPGWFYVRDKKRLGPVPEEELKALAARGQLSRDDMVLREGETRWAAASSVPGLYPASAAVTPVVLAEALLVEEPSAPGFTLQEALLVEETPAVSPPHAAPGGAPPTARATWVTCPHCKVFVPVTEQEKTCPACHGELRSAPPPAPPTPAPPAPTPSSSASPTARAIWLTCPHCEVSVPVTEHEKTCPACLKDLSAPASTPLEPPPPSASPSKSLPPLVSGSMSPPNPVAPPSPVTTESPPPMPPPGWYYVREKKKLGPVPVDELKGLAGREQLGPDDMVLKQGENRWATARATFSDWFPAPTPRAEAPGESLPRPAPPPVSLPSEPVAAEVPPLPPESAPEVAPSRELAPTLPLLPELPPIEPNAIVPFAEPVRATPEPEAPPPLPAAIIAPPEPPTPPPPPEPPPALIVAEAILVEEAPFAPLAEPVSAEPELPWPPAPPAPQALPTLPDLGDAPPEELLARFQNDWLHGRRPELDDYLPSTAAARDAVLPRLLRVDLECRLRGGEDVRVENYLQRFPSLQADRTATLDALAAEYELRRRWQPNLNADEYATRFPELAGDLKARLSGIPGAPGSPAAPSAAPAVETSPPTPPAPEEVSASAKTTVPTLPLLPGFEILDVIHDRKDDTLYKARQTEPLRTVALRLLRADGPDARRRELEVLRRVARLHHANLATVHDSAAYGPEREGRYYVAAEWVDAPSLPLRTHGWPVPPRQAVEWIEAIAVALHEAHQHDLVHGSVTPTNLVLFPEAEGRSTARLLGLGVPPPRPMFESLTPGDVGSAAIAYLAPEQTRGEGAILSPATDVYALGAVLFELLTGRPPFREPSVAKMVERIQSSRPPLVSAVQPGLPLALEFICAKCLQKMPADRYASTQELAADLRRYLAGTPVLPPHQRVWFLIRTRPVVSALIAALILCLIFLLGSSSKISRLQRDIEALKQKQAEKEATSAEARH